jgi:bifunctional DNA-binding transcriptional regulator/antitoxin component of YhaV-PrlF toxin-antitoxin module
MPTITTIERVDGELRVAVSEEMLEHRRLKEGDRVHVIESSNGILIVPFDDDFEEAMQLYEEGAAAYDELLQQFSN